MAAKKVERQVQPTRGVSVKSAKDAKVGAAKRPESPPSRPTKDASTTGLLPEGSKLPRAKLLDQDGNSVDLAQFAGAWLVVYFYPKDDTPGCTREACSFQENLSAFKRVKTVVVGVSSDSVVRHRKFADKYGLSFPLLVDEDRAFANACGVVGEKVLYGKRSIGVVRSTFIVDPTGVIRRTFYKVKVDGHTASVLEALKLLR